MSAPTWRTGLWVYPWDTADEGTGSVIDNAHDRAGVNELSLAVSYHSGMFLLPHNPARKLYFPEPGLYFEPERQRYASLAIQPRVDRLAETGIVEAVRHDTERHGLKLNAWTVCLHNSDIGRRHPEATTLNAFGDRHLPNLCPANPDVRAYIGALIGDIAARGFDAILVESLDYQPYGHGYHHEVAGVPLTPFISYLLGLCFCDHCLAAARRVKVNGQAVRDFVRREVQAFFDGDLAAGRDGITWPELRSLAGGELGAFHEMRSDVVTSLYDEVRSTWPRSDGPRLEIIDFGPFRPLGWDGSAQESGLDLRAVAPYVDAAHPCLYFTSAAAVAAHAQEYWQRAPDHWSVLPAIRAIPPQIRDEAGLTAAVLAGDPQRAAGYSFYNYGFMRLTTLDWIHRALTTAAADRQA